MARGIPKAIPKKPGPYHARQPPPIKPYNANAAYRSRPMPTVEASLPNLNKSQRVERSANTARSIGKYGMAAGALGMGFYLVQLYLSYSQSSDEAPRYSPSVQKDVSGVYDQTAEGFDTEVNFTEWAGGINKARKHMAGMAQGHVLEVSAGTARNMAYYKFGKIQSLTLIDLSEQMVEESRKKWDILNPGKVFDHVPVRFIQGDCTADMPGPPSEKTEGGTAFNPGLNKGYDTIVQTMGLCSTPAPVQLLKNLSRHLDHSNPNARILLLEHGRSYYEWVNKILDVHAPKHADKHGCWWNRDIGEMVEESGLEIVQEKRKHFGTTWIYELKPATKTAEVKKMAGEVSQQIQSPAPAQKGWLSWLSI